MLLDHAARFRTFGHRELDMPSITNKGGVLSAAGNTNKVSVDTAIATTAVAHPTRASPATWVITTKTTPNPLYTVGQVLDYLSTHSNHNAIHVTVQNGPNKYTGTGTYPM